MTECQYFNITTGNWASSGHRNNYKWFAVTNYFDAKLFNINEYATICNEQVREKSKSLGGYWKILKAQLDNEQSLNNHSNICVMNTEDIYRSDTQLEMNERVRDYFSFYKSIISNQNGRLGIDPNVIKNKILVIPFVYLDSKSQEFLDFIAPKLVQDCSVQSIYVIFACNIAKDANDKFPSTDNFPYIDQNSFAIQISYESFRSLMNLMNNTKPTETFNRRAKPVNLSGTSWKSNDGKYTIKFDSASVNGSEYNGDFAIYYYDATTKQLQFTVDDMIEGFRYVHKFKVLSLTSDKMELEGKNGLITLSKL